ncbi:MAG: Grx4 family monothiol glutaredoxin [Wenzhouxiangellaceae bacterium]
MALDTAVHERIHSLVTGHPVVLFMKGTPSMPQCGFSAQTVRLLSSVIGDDYIAVNVLEDPEIREGIKVYGDWPTIPQLYVKGELVGGCDIVTEMFNSGELHQLFGKQPPDRTPPEIEISDKAAARIRDFLAAYPGQHLHLQIGADWSARFELGPKTGTEIESRANGLSVLMDLDTAQRARGAKIDWVESMQGEGLKLDLPGAPPAVRSMTPEELKRRLASGEPLVVVDVRGEEDRNARPLPGARPLDAGLMAELESADRNTPLVFVCNRGQSSLQVAEHYRRQGFVEVYNLEGGMAALDQA